MALKADHGGTMPPKQTSAPQNTSTGSGSRPNASKITIQTSAPDNAHTLGRAAPNWLK